MITKPLFKFRRERGIVWVVDLEQSTSFLNSNDTVSSMEVFLPRLYWLSQQLVEGVGGRFVKWTGDGFLAWFPIRLERDLGKRSVAVFQAATFLSTLVELTNLGVRSDKPFILRHGITYEPDGLVFKIFGSKEADDLIGRSVVLAFRLSGVRTHFPGIVTQEHLVSAYKMSGGSNKIFSKRKFSKADRSRFLKDEPFGVDSICDCISSDSITLSDAEDILEFGNRLIAIMEAIIPHDSEGAAIKIMNILNNGPRWARHVKKIFHNHLKTEFKPLVNKSFKAFKRIADIIDKSVKKKYHRRRTRLTRK